MSSETENTTEDRTQDDHGGQVGYVRLDAVKSFWRAIAGGGVLAVLVALFVALGISSRDYSKAIADNLRDVTGQWNENFKELTNRVTDLERWAWSKGKR